MLARLALLTLLVGIAIPATWALPVKPDLKRMIEEQDKPKVQYPVARAGWDGPEDRGSIAFNPTYEQMRYRYTAAGRRAQLVAAITPDWRVWGMFGFLVLALRYYHRHKPHAAAPRPAGVIAFPKLKEAA